MSKEASILVEKYGQYDMNDLSEIAAPNNHNIISGDFIPLIPRFNKKA